MGLLLVVVLHLGVRCFVSVKRKTAVQDFEGDFLFCNDVFGLRESVNYRNSSWHCDKARSVDEYRIFWFEFRQNDIVLVKRHLERLITIPFLI